MSFGSLKTEEKTERQCGQSTGLDRIRLNVNSVAELVSSLTNEVTHIHSRGLAPTARTRQVTEEHSPSLPELSK